MLKHLIHATATLLSIIAMNTYAQLNSPNTTNKKEADTVNAVITTSMGDVHVALDKKNAPVTVNNFIQYINTGFYENTIFHRVIKGFMIQGGGFNTNMQKKPTNEPITNEANNGLSNTRGTLAMARTSIINSATSQFFINTTNNNFLDNSSRDFGYAVFGKVTKGMDVIDSISNVKTTLKKSHSNVPVDNIVIKSISIQMPQTPKN